jgi:uncharacterized membrane protein
LEISFKYFYFVKKSTFNIKLTAMKSFKISSTSQILLLLSVSSLLMFFGRWVGTGSRYYVYLDWNLFLAWVPLWVAQILTHTHQKHRFSTPSLALGSVVWLLFFPNAPYLITDLIHLKNSPESLIWYDAIMHFLFAFSGVLTGLYSMLVVHRLLAKQYSTGQAWVAMVVATVASSYGVFLGRFGRWNTWDVLTNPLQLIKYSLLQLQNAHAVQVTIAFSFATIVMYVSFYLVQKRVEAA